MKTLDLTSETSPESTKPCIRQSYWLGAIACSGLIAAISGLALLVVYSKTPGPTGDTPKFWPKGSKITRDIQRPTLAVFLHPRCFCSRATVQELERLLVGRGFLRTVVVMLRPAQSPVGWEQGPVLELSRSIGGVEVQIDEGGEEARRFGVETSGHVCLYGTDGQLQFSGGITLARGHEGENRGVAAIERLLAGGQAEPTNCVFGCKLFSACERPTSGEASKHE